MSDLKQIAIGELERLFGSCTKLPRSNSLYEFNGSVSLRVYFRYSKNHGGKAFFGLRQTDLRQLDGVVSAICLLWDDQAAPVFLPFDEYEEVFREASPASDGQYKVQVYDRSGSVEVFIPRIGRFSADAHLGWQAIRSIAGRVSDVVPRLSHRQVQSILGVIGTRKGCDIWIPPNDRSLLNPTIVSQIRFRDQLPSSIAAIASAVPEIDAIWLERASGTLRSLFEVEHSTPIYSGLLRFNDFMLSSPSSDAQFTVVSNEERRAVYVRQIRRPTFVASGLHERCTFLPYRDVYLWFQRMTQGELTDFITTAVPTDHLSQPEMS